MADLPYFKFYAMDYLGGDIQHFSALHQAVFMQIVARAWKDGGWWERNDNRLARVVHADIVDVTAVVDELLAEDILVESGVAISAEFIGEQMADRKDFISKCSLAGKKGARSRSGNVPSRSVKGTCNQLESELESESDTDKEGERNNFSEGGEYWTFVNQHPDYRRVLNEPMARGLSPESYAETMRKYSDVTESEAVDELLSSLLTSSLGVDDVGRWFGGVVRRISNDKRRAKDKLDRGQDFSEDATAIAAQIRAKLPGGCSTKEKRAIVKKLLDESGASDIVKAEVKKLTA